MDRALIHSSAHSSVDELVRTEESYLVDLTDILRGYYQPMSEQMAAGLVDGEADVLFGNVRDLHTFHQLLCRQLQTASGNIDRISQCFISREEEFVTLYSFYCANYPNAVSLLSELIATNQQVFHMLARAQTQLGHALPLASYILKPVQRILKYQLLLEEIARTHAHIASERQLGLVRSAISVCWRVAQQVNEIQRMYEEKVHVQEIQSLLINWPNHQLTSYGVIRLEDEFRMLGARDLRQLFLLDDILLVTKFTEAGFLQHKAHVVNSNLIVLETVPKEPLAFQVAPYDNSSAGMTFVASTPEKKRTWIKALRRCIIDSYNESIPRSTKNRLLQLDPVVQDITQHRRASLIGIVSPFQKTLQPPAEDTAQALRRRISGLSASPVVFRENHQRNRSVIQRKASEAQMDKARRKSMSLKLVDKAEIETIKANVQVNFRKSCEQIYQEDDDTYHDDHKAVTIQRCKSEINVNDNPTTRRMKKVSSSYEPQTEVKIELWRVQRRVSNAQSTSNIGHERQPRRSSSGVVARLSPSEGEDERQSTDQPQSQSEEHETTSDYNSSIVLRSNALLRPRRFLTKAASFATSSAVSIKTAPPLSPILGPTRETSPSASIYRSNRDLETSGSLSFSESATVDKATYSNQKQFKPQESLQKKRQSLAAMLLCCLRFRKKERKLADDTSQFHSTAHVEETRLENNPREQTLEATSSGGTRHREHVCRNSMCSSLRHKKQSKSSTPLSVRAGAPKVRPPIPQIVINQPSIDSLESAASQETVISGDLNASAEDGPSTESDEYLEKLQHIQLEAERKQAALKQQIQASISNQLTNIQKQQSIVKTIYNLQQHSSAQPPILL